MMDDSHAAADALAWAADELERYRDTREETDAPTDITKHERGQILTDARWLRKQAVAMRGRLPEG